MRPTRRSSLLLVVIALLIGLMGLAFVGGGVWLVSLKGSWYYAVAGVALLLVAVLLFAARPLSLWVYAALLLATLAWSLWEVGLAWWGIAARGDVFFLVGLLLLTPWVARRLAPDAAGADAQRSRSAPWTGGRALLGLVLVVYLGVAVVSWFVDPFATVGDLPTAREPLPAVTAATAAVAAASAPAGEWRAYGGNAAGQRYAPLAQITPGNVDKLQMAWTFHSGDVRGQPGDPVETTYEVTPLKIGNRLFLCTPHQFVIALDATTGAELWRFDPKVAPNLALQHLTCRGLSYQPAAAAAPPPAATPAPAPAPASGGVPSAPVGDCSAKLFMPTADARLIALNPENGQRCAGFGTDGQIDLWAGMPNVEPGSYYSTSPPVVTQRLVVIAGTVLDNVSTQEASGVIRAFDIETGRLVWNWDSGKPDQTTPLPAGQTYTANSPNSWSILSVDEGLGLVYAPMGNQPPDQWGGKRTEAVEKHSSSVVALDLATGQARWVYQTVHHDLWDYDVPAQPSLIDLAINGATVPALVQPTKQGELFVLDRRTGQPVLPVEERPSPQGASAGDHTAPTQPKSALSFEPKPLTGADMWGGTPFDQLGCRIAFHKLRYEGRFTPPTTGGSLIYPGNFGVFNWGGVAVDPVRQVVFGTPTYLAFVSKLVPRPDNTTRVLPGNEPPQGNLPALNENFGAPYAAQMGAFTSVFGIPCQAPPWGYVAGADLTTGKVAWMHRNGTVRDLSPLPLPFKMGVPNLGGPVITAGGVVFLSGTLDYYLRAYDLTNGRELWKSRLPAGGQATPMTYLGADGRQFVLAVAGGHGSLGTKPGDAIMAFALPAGAAAP